MTNRLRVAPVVVALLLLCGAAAMGAPTKTPTKAPAAVPAVDAQSKAVLEKMASFLASAKAFSVHADVCNETVLPSGVKVQRCSQNDAFIERPNRLHVTAVGDLANRSIWYDGTPFSVLFPAKKLYVSAEAPATLDAAIDWAIQKTGIAPPLADYVYSDPLPGLLEGVRLSHYLGDSLVNGVKCKHLAFKQATINWQLWVEDSETPVPRKLLIEYKNDPGAPQYSAVLSDWKFSETLPADLFVFTPPEGASRMQLVMSTPEVK